MVTQEAKSNDYVINDCPPLLHYTVSTVSRDRYLKRAKPYLSRLKGEHCCVFLLYPRFFLFCLL